ncbi:hypothetical protein ICY20_18060 [Pseudomonas sp. P115]|uniref:hypothetical protein n=1 Tax=Pseudomonas pisciculturae TaxID=2730413 RepID=UPI0018925D50|nr:hypothetical protein [Pseudomonas pisciculturae]MBF6029657.1 hypothetical protein [Pseudomonas pisciculturae]
MDVSEWTLTATAAAAVAAAVSAITSAVSASAARRAIAQNESITAASRIREDHLRENARLLEHATTTLERAYAALMGANEQLNVPPRNRINWLTSARLIEEFKSTKLRIDDPLLLQECLSHEMHWRNQFSFKLEQLGVSHPDYFRQSGKEIIQLTSAVIVCGFSTWPDEYNDPIDKYSTVKEAVNQIGVSHMWAHLRFHLELQ